MDYSYLITPLVAWLFAGSLKFAVNSIRAGRPAFDLIGYGGFPSNHAAIVSSTAGLIALKEGMHHPAFGVAMTLVFIVLLDAKSLRTQVGKHARAINHLSNNAAAPKSQLRESIGHTSVELVAGVCTGVTVAYAMWRLT